MPKMAALNNAAGRSEAVNNIVAFPQQRKEPESRDAKDLPRRSNSTINVIIAAVSSFYDYQVRLGNIAPLGIYNQNRNFLGGTSTYKPFLHNISSSSNQVDRNLLKLKTAQMRPKVISREEFKRLLAACTHDRDRFLLCLLYETGMRAGQALGLRHEDVRSFDNKIIICPRQDNANGARAKTLSSYSVDVSKELMQLYARYLTEECIETESDYVFINLWGGQFGRPMRYTAMLDLFRRLERKTSIRIHSHMFRHTHATEMMRATGGRVDLVSRRLGHSSIQTTLKIYSHLTDDDLKRAYQEYENKRGKLNYGNG